MGRRPEDVTIRVTHSCDPDPGAVDRAIQMWAAFIAENRRRKSLSFRQPSATDNVG